MKCREDTLTAKVESYAFMQLVYSFYELLSHERVVPCASDEPKTYVRHIKRCVNMVKWVTKPADEPSIRQS